MANLLLVVQCADQDGNVYIFLTPGRKLVLMMGWSTEDGMQMRTNSQ
jgi:phage protein D